MSETAHDEPEPATEPRASGFEFGEEHNRLFGQLARRMHVVGIAILVWGAFQVPRAIGGDVGALALTLALAVTGIWTVMAARQFGAIPRTEGSDVGHLMRALWSVHNLYTLAASIIAVIVIWIVAALGFTAFVTLR